MVIEAGVAAAYVIAWAVRKAKRIGGRLDVETDAMIDVSLERLHEVVSAKLAGHPVLAELVEETEGDAAEVSELTRQQVELALTAAARKDDAFGQAVMELVARLRATEQAAGSSVIAGPGSAVFTGSAEAKAESGGIAVGQVAGALYINRGLPDPSQPGRPSH